jgi:hypothetical protein
VENIVVFFAVLKPLFDCSIIIPTVVPGESFHGEHIWVIKNFVFFGEDCKGFASGLVLIEVVFFFGKEGSFFDNVLVLFNNVSVAGRQALK